MAEHSKYSCIVPDCTNTEEDKSLRFYSLPHKDPEICEEWITRIQNPNLDNHIVDSKQKICEIHFRYICKTGFDSQLQENSLPTLHLPTVKVASKNTMKCFAAASKTASTNKFRFLKKEKMLLEVENYLEVCRFCYRKGMLYDIEKSTYNIKVGFLKVIKTLVPEYKLNSSSQRENMCLECAKLLITGYLIVQQIKTASKAFAFVLEPLNNHRIRKRSANVAYPSKIDMEAFLINSDLKLSVESEKAYCSAKDLVVEVPQPSVELEKNESDSDFEGSEKAVQMLKESPKCKGKVLTPRECKRLKVRVENMPSTSKRKSAKTVVDDASFGRPILLNLLKKYKSKRTSIANYKIVKESMKPVDDNNKITKQNDDVVSVKNEIDKEEDLAEYLAQEDIESLTSRSILKEEHVETALVMQESFQHNIGVVENSIDLLETILQKSEHDHSMLINGETDEREIFEEIDNEDDPEKAKRQLLVNFSCAKGGCDFKMDVCQDYTLKTEKTGKVCDFRTANSEDYKKHMRSQHKDLMARKGANRRRANVKQVPEEVVQCLDCGNFYKNQKQLKRHKYMAHGLRLECRICHKMVRKRYMSTHQAIHTTEKKFRCLICSKMFRTLVLMRKHMEIHSSDKKDLDESEAECNICHKTFKGKRSLASHKASHAARRLERKKRTTSEQPIKTYGKLCPICGETNYKNYSYHMLKHSKIKRFKCELCKYETNFKPLMVRHMLTHTGEKPFLCTVCGQSFTQNVCLKSHSKMHIVLSKPIECSLCGETFPTKYELRVHGQIHGIPLLRKGPMYCKTNINTSRLRKNLGKAKAAKNSNCTKCNESFYNSFLLKVHVIEKHEEVKGYFKCAFCNEGFDKYAARNKHVVHEHNTAGRTCEVCHKVFLSRKHVEVHMRSHTGERPYKCDLCPSMFYQKQHLKYHKMRVHEMRKPFPCKLCKKAFPSSQNLKEHVRTHTGERLKCGHCDKTFAGNSNRSKHMREVHNIHKKPLCVKIE